MENKSWVLMMVGLFFAIICVAGITYTSKNNKTGAWEVAGSWAGAKPSNTAIGSDDIINIDGYVTRNGNYDVSGDATIHIYDTLVITGDLTMSQLSTNTGIKVHAGGLLIVLGNFSSNNSGGNLLDVQAGGRAVIVKNYDQKQGVVKAAGDLYVFDDTPTFSWGSSVDGTNYNGSNGPLASKLDDETDLVSNDKSLAKFLESLGVGTLICSATPTYISKTGTGNWTAAGSWSGTKPSYTLTGGSYTIPTNEVVTINGNITVSAANLIVYGTLIVNGKLIMDAGKMIDIKNGGTVTCCQNCNNSNKIVIGGNTAWTGNDGTIEGPAVINSTGVLPITLLSFNGKSEGAYVELTWATASEENFDRFEIERSVNGLVFETLGTQQGSGSDTYHQRVYTFIDKSPAAGRNYYRLKNIDLDNTFEYSFIIKVEASQERSISIYPNPVVNQTLFVQCNFESAASAKIQVIDHTGAVLFEYSEVSTQQELNFNGKLAAGLYILRYKSDEPDRNFRFIVK